MGMRKSEHVVVMNDWGSYIVYGPFKTKELAEAFAEKLRAKHVGDDQVKVQATFMIGSRGSL